MADNNNTPNNPLSPVVAAIPMQIESIGKQVSKVADNTNKIATDLEKRDAEIKEFVEKNLNATDEQKEAMLSSIKSRELQQKEYTELLSKLNDEQKQLLQDAAKENGDLFSFANEKWGSILKQVTDQALSAEEMKKSMEEMQKDTALIADINNKQLLYDKEAALAARWAKDKGDVKEGVKPNEGTELKDSFADAMKNLPKGFGLGDLVGLAIASIIFGVDEYLRTWAVATLTGVTEGFAKILSFLKSAWRLIIDGVKVGMIDDAAKTIQKIKNWFNAKTSAGFKKFLNIILKPFNWIFSMLRWIGDGIMRPLRALKEGAGKFLGMFSKFGSIFKVLGSKLLLPIFLVIDGVTGFIEGFKEGGILGGIKGAISNIFAQFIGAPLNLLKDLFGWVMSKFLSPEKYEALKATLDEIDFIQSIKTGFSDFFGWIENFIKQILDFDFWSLVPGGKWLKEKLGFGEDKTVDSLAEKQAILETPAEEWQKMSKKDREKLIDQRRDMFEDMSDEELTAEKLRVQRGWERKTKYLKEKSEKAAIAKTAPVVVAPSSVDQSSTTTINNSTVIDKGVPSGRNAHDRQPVQKQYQLQTQ